MRPVVILSGGMDSATLLYHLIESAELPIALSFDYGQRHAIELDSARALCQREGIRHTMVRASFLRGILSGSSQTSSDIAVPRGHYTDESMKQTVVPNRNMVMLSIAVGFAIAQGCDTVAFAAHAGDHPIYPDCRPVFVEALQAAVTLGNWDPVQLYAPYLAMSKAAIAAAGAEMGVPFHLTWSCYDPQPKPGEVMGRLHCGRCGTCVERREAFELAGLEDPTEYA